MTTKTALVVGATGIIGRYLVEHLETLEDWHVVGLARRVPSEARPKTRNLSVDLLDAEAATAALAPLKEITHVFHAAYLDRPSMAELVKPNLALLVNAIEALDPVAPALERVVLVEGTKYYGGHLGPFKTPAKEDDPRTMPPMFYFDQEDFLRSRGAGARWSWSALRPQTLCGFAVGFPMNILTVIAVYAAISKELGLPLRFPGKPGAYRSLYQVTESSHLAKALVWAATEAGCAGEAFNITNGDFFRWENLWPRIAELFEMPVGPVQTIRLTEFMADKGPLWQTMVARDELCPHAYDEIAAWPFADYVFGCDWDVMSSMTKARQYGFNDVVDSEEMFLRQLSRLRADRIVP